ncbi:MAG: esterase family protein [Bacteroidaceae bacterium]|nr:esterase family protein [Bacteroidaceae bacterium]
MRRTTLSLLAFVFGLSTLFAQQAIFERQNIVSPQKNDDGTVTLRLRAPGAQKVEVMGDCIDGYRKAMTKDENGVWTYTTQPLAPELYSYRFYADGVELQDPANWHRSRDVRSFMSTFIISKEEGDCGYLYENHNVPHGNIQQVWYDSKTLGMARRMSIYTPAGYEKGGNYPVLYLLHGSGGDEDAWLTLGRASQVLDNLIAAGKAVPMIVVMTNGHADNDASPEFTALARRERQKASFEESFPEVKSYIEKNFRVKKGADNTAMCGLSMGGFHTFHLSLMNPGMFGYLGLFSAAVRMDRGSNKSIDQQIADDATVSAQIAAVFKAKPHLYWIGIGKTDFLYEQNKGLRAYLDKMGYPYEYYENEDGHIWRNWRIYLTIFSQKLFK